MITLRRQSAFVVLAAAVAVLAVFLPRAQARNNPYDGIVERNPFNLKPVPLAVAETNETVATPPVKVVLTGITSMFGPNSKLAFLEMTEQQPAGKAAANPIRSMLREGDREGDIEVLSIDIDRSIVKIRNGGAESELTFEVPKPAAATPTGHAAPNTAAAAAPAPSQPIIISSSESRGGVTMAGGGSGFQGNGAGVTSFGGSTPMMAGNSGGISSYGGVNPASYGGGGNLGGSFAGGIPSRTIRTPVTETKLDQASRDLILEANRIRNQQVAATTGRPMPPLPPTSLTPHLQDSPGGGGGGPPAFPPFPKR